MANKNRLDKLEDHIGPKPPDDDMPIILHKDGEARPITPEELKKIKGEFIRIIEHDKTG